MKSRAVAMGTEEASQANIIVLDRKNINVVEMTNISTEEASLAARHNTAP